MQIPVLASIALLVTIAVACSGASVVYPIDIVLSTTSDWTDVSIIGANLVIVLQEILEGANAPNLRIDRHK